MRDTALPNPGLYTSGQNLRRQIAKAISAAEIAARKAPSGTTPVANGLYELFVAASVAVAALQRASEPATEQTTTDPT